MCFNLRISRLVCTECCFEYVSVCVSTLECLVWFVLSVVLSTYLYVFHLRISRLVCTECCFEYVSVCVSTLEFLIWFVLSVVLSMYLCVFQP